MRLRTAAVSGLLMCCAPAVASGQAAPWSASYTAPTREIALAPSARRVSVDDVEFQRITAIVPRTDGGFVVADAGLRQLLYFGPTGAAVRTVGRRGAGPGEYGFIRGAVALRADTLAVWDTENRRITILSPTGAYVRVIALEAPWDGGGSVTRVLALTDGSLMVGYSEVQTMAPRPTPVRFGERLFVYASDGTRRPGAGLTLPSSEHFIQEVPPERGRVAYWSLAFGRVLTVRPTPTGIATGDGTAWAVEERAPGTWAVTGSHTMQRSVVPVTPQDRSGYAADAVRNESGLDLELGKRRAAEMPFPRTKPAYVRFESDPSGRLWIEEYEQRSEPQARWIRLDRTARTATAVRMPMRFQPMAFTNGSVIGIWRDEDDVPSVQVYALP